VTQILKAVQYLFKANGDYTYTDNYSYISNYLYISSYI